MSSNRLIDFLKLPPELQCLDLDDPNNVYTIRKIINRNPFLTNCYKSFYRDILNRLKTVPSNGELIELGSGASFLRTLLPQLITSDILPYSGVDRVFSALDIPLIDDSVSAFLMTNVLHHLKDSKQFFREMRRCLKPGGKVIMMEPANTLWSRFIYTNFHPEPFDPTGDWGFEEGGPLTGANMAIPWIIFFRDIDTFKVEFPELAVKNIRLHSPFQYLLSGGLSYRQLLPNWAYGSVSLLEWILTPFNPYLAMFMTIELERQ